MKLTTREIIQCAIFIAIIIICAYITIPFGAIPFTLQTFGFTLCALCNKPKVALITSLFYFAIGAIGVPVFSSMRGGIGTILGASGGFLIGYTIMVPICSYINNITFFKKFSNKKILVIRFLIGLLMTFVAYIFGMAQYSYIAGVSLIGSLYVAVLPFIFPDIIKIAIASAMSISIEKHI